MLLRSLLSPLQRPVVLTRFVECPPFLELEHFCLRPIFLVQRLYDYSRWSNLIRSFRLAVYNLNTLPNEPLLHLALYGGLASLKLPACYDPHTKNVDCPVCDGESAALNAAGNSDVTMSNASIIGSSNDIAEHGSQSSTTSLSTSGSDGTTTESMSTSGSSLLGLGKLAEEVPFSHHANSTIVCRITGKIMDEDNMPMAFPNGNVYSLEVRVVVSTGRFWGY